MSRSLPIPSSPNPNYPGLSTLNHLRSISNLWDEAIAVPGTSFRVGLESLIGLLPIGGDVVGLILSSYILFRAAQLGLPRSILAQMLFNVLLDAVAGSVPLLGDLFDTTWKANTRNVNLLETYLQAPDATHRTSCWLIVGLVSILLLVTLSLLALFIWIFYLLGQSIGTHP